MKKSMLYFVAMGTLMTSVSANAAYWQCIGEKVRAGFGQSPYGLLLVASRNGINMLEIKTSVELEDLTFNSSEKRVLDVVKVTVQNKQYTAELNIEKGEFTMTDKKGKVLSDQSMKCTYSNAE